MKTFAKILALVLITWAFLLLCSCSEDVEVKPRTYTFFIELRQGAKISHGVNGFDHIDTIYPPAEGYASAFVVKPGDVFLLRIESQGMAKVHITQNGTINEEIIDIRPGETISKNF